MAGVRARILVVAEVPLQALAVAVVAADTIAKQEPPKAAAVPAAADTPVAAVAAAAPETGEIIPETVEPVTQPVVLLQVAVEQLPVILWAEMEGLPAARVAVRVETQAE